MRILRLKEMESIDKALLIVMAVSIAVLFWIFTSIANNSWLLEAEAQTATSTPQSSTSTLPSVPLSFSATPVSTSQINLSWLASSIGTATSSTSSSNSIWGYNIYRNSGLLATTTSTVYQDTGLSSGTTYSYYITAGDTMGNTSGQSNTISATTFLPATTTPPTTTPPTTTPPTTNTPPWSNTNSVGWMVIPLSLYNQLSNGTGTSTPNNMPITYDSHGYPKWNGHYINCEGQIDNDPAHHTIDPNDHDPAHQVGKNCPGGAPKQPTGSGLNMWNSGGMPGNAMNFWLWNNGQTEQWIAIPLNKNNIQKLLSVMQ